MGPLNNNLACAPNKPESTQENPHQIPHSTLHHVTDAMSSRFLNSKCVQFCIFQCTLRQLAKYVAYFTTASSIDKNFTHKIINISAIFAFSLNI